MATEDDTNVFAKPWKHSDLVLIVDGKELHVHKSILEMQSPVFDMMLNGDFKEGSNDNIPLEGDNFELMVQFLKLLYPSSMFREVRSLKGENLLSILMLADKYQCVNFIRECIDEAKITQDTVLYLLYHVGIYHKSALNKLFDVVNNNISTEELEAFIYSNQTDDKTKNSLIVQMLLCKCRFLEPASIL
ncbi:BTB and MATH domain-containing 38-like [Paramuricea clavata]|uniref:BTB and MATH domain-containing 38-like n=1 Tax=Paramuricea clavata TaxID=317549 RepID=A0A6S7IPQ1_PARCT|nr:BTB and MATH domain-containing 38-like [Paramuricea clavata]